MKIKLRLHISYWIPFLLLLLGVIPVQAANFVVVNTLDSGPGSLRQAIQDANLSVGADTITFTIGGSGVKIIRPFSALPSLTDAVTIDGYTQAGAKPNNLSAGSDAILNVVMDGSFAGNAVGIRIASSNCLVRGLVIHSFKGTGLSIFAGTSNSVEGCYIGVTDTGNSALPNAAGINISTDNNRLGGSIPASRNIISGNTGAGVTISGSGNSIQGNIIGADASGTLSIANDRGINLLGDSNSVGGAESGSGNLISGNKSAGIRVLADSNIIQGNFIGTTADGTQTLANFYGVELVSDGNTIGGSTAGTRNTISGNRFHGITMEATSNFIFGDKSYRNNVIQGNYIGTDKNGQRALKNGGDGIHIEGCNANTIGGTDIGAGNLISGNAGSGISISSASGAVFNTIKADSNIVQGNRVGTNATGTQAIGNAENGIELLGRATRNIIGGGSRGATNLISGNTLNGILLSAGSSFFDDEAAVPTGNRLQGNDIGTGANGAGAIGNGLNGVILRSGAHANFIGVTSSAGSVYFGNTIGFNRLDGVQVQGVETIGNAIRGNSIFSNNGLGVNLTGGEEDSNNVTTNHVVPPSGADPNGIGPNHLQNYPVITSVAVANSTTTIAGKLNGSPATNFVIDVYRNTQIDPSGYGEGAVYVGSVSVNTDAGGNTGFSLAVNHLYPGQFFTATATNTQTGDSSEFSSVPAQLLDFTPKQGPTGTSVTITGINIGRARSVQFNGIRASFTVISPTQIKATVPSAIPQDLASGHIRIVTPLGALLSKDSFTVQQHPANDNFRNAERLTGTTSRDAVFGSNLGATVENGEPKHAQQAGDSSIWYVWQAPASGEAEFDTQGSEFDTVLAVYTGTTVTALNSIASNDDADGAATSRVGFSVVAGRSYRIAVAGARHSVGRVLLHWSLGINAPPNDNFVDAHILDGRFGTVNSSNARATREVGEPPHTGNAASTSIWYKWDPPQSGTVTFDTKGSNFDTRLAVYRSTRFGSPVALRDLSQIVANDDAGVSFTSQVTFVASSNFTYYIAVDGSRGAEGKAALNWLLGTNSGRQFHWDNVQGGVWSNPSNWKEHSVPGPQDFAFIDLDGSYTVTLDIDTAVAGITVGAARSAGGDASSAQTLDLNAHSLTLDQASSITNAGVVSLSAGSLTNHDNLTITGTFYWNGGTLRGKSTRYINPGGQLIIGGTVTKYLVQGTIANFGTIEWHDSGIIRCGNAVTWDNESLFSIYDDAAFIWDQVGDRPDFFNSARGTVKKLQGSLSATTAFKSVSFSNDGLLQIDKGVLALQGGGVSYGNFQMASGARIDFSSDYFFDKQASSFTGEGIARILDGTIAINNPVTTHNLELAGGVLTGAQDLSGHGTLLWQAGSMTGKGSTTVSGSQGLLRITSVAAKQLSGRSINIVGTAELQFDAASKITAGDGATINNAAICNAGKSSVIAYNQSGAVAIFNNAGTLNLPGSAARSTFLSSRSLAGSETPNPKIAISSGIFAIYGNYNQRANGILNLSISDAGHYDQLSVQAPMPGDKSSGVVRIDRGSILRIHLDATPAAGTTFFVIRSASAIQGQFKIEVDLAGQSLPVNHHLEPEYTANGLMLRVIADKHSLQGNVMTTAGIGIPDAAVTLINQDTQSRLTATSDVRGHYAFSPVSIGRYSVAPQLQDCSFVDSPRTMVLSNKDLTDVNFTAQFNLQGRVSNGAGAGVPNVMVHLSPVVASKSTPLVTTRSDSHGNYRFTGLSAGRYSVRAERPAYSFSPAESTVDLTNASRSGVDIVQLMTITGQVKNELGAGVRGVPVRCSRPNIVALTDDHGSYNLSNLTGGTYDVVPTLAGHAFTGNGRVRLNTDNVAHIDFTIATLSTQHRSTIRGKVLTGAGVGIPNIEVRCSGSSTSIRTDANGVYSFNNLVAGSYAISPILNGATFDPPQRLILLQSGDVSFVDFRRTYRLIGRVTSNGSVGVAGVRITRSGADSPERPARVTTNGQGYFTFVNVAAGAYSLQANRPDYTFEPVVTRVQVSDSDLQDISFVERFFIEGRVLSGNGSSVSGVAVRCNSLPTVTTNTDGKYRFGPLPAGQYVVTPQGTTYGFQPSTRTISLTGSNASQVDFEQTYSIRGVVRDRTGFALAGMRVNCRSQVTNTVVASVTTDSGGIFTFLNLSSSSYVVTPSLGGYAFLPEILSVTIDHVNINDLRFIGMRTPSISGRITNDVGAALPGVTVTRTTGAGATSTAVTDANGYYIYEAVPAGGYGLGASLQGWLFSPPFGAITVQPGSGVVSGPDFVGTTLPNSALSARTANAANNGLTLSSASVRRDDKSGEVQLRFNRPLQRDSAAEIGHYLVLLNGLPATIESASYSGANNTVTLSLVERLNRRDTIVVLWYQLLDGQGMSSAGQSGVLPVQ